MNIKQFISKYDGITKGYPNDTYYNGECLSIVKLWMKEKYGFEPPPSGSNSAYGYWTNFPSPLSQYYTKEANTSDLVPQEEWIPIWNTNAGNGYGHIEIVCDNKADKQYFNSFGQNWNGKQGHITRHNYKNVVGFLKPKEQTMADTIQVEKKVFEDLVRKSTAYDEILTKYGVADQQGLYNMVAGLQARSTDLGNQIGALQAEVKNREEQSRRFEDRVIENEAVINDLRIQLKESQNEVDIMAQDKGSLQIEVEQLKTQLTTAKQGEITLTFMEIITALLNKSIKISKK